MARSAYIDPRSFARADALIRATLGDNALRVLLTDQREAIAYDLKYGVGTYDPVIPYMRRKVDALIGTQRLKDFDGDKPTLVRRKMPFATRVIFSQDEEQEIDLRRELILLRAMLMAASSNNVLFRYRTTFKFWIGGQVMNFLPPNGDFAIGGVVNTHSYAPKVECQKWFRPYRLVWRIVNRVDRKRRMDVRIRNLQGITEVSKGRPWPSPVIELGYLNSMRGKTGNLLGRQRCNGQTVFPIG